MTEVQFLNDKCLWICCLELHLSLVIGSRSPSARICLVNLFAGCHFVSKDVYIPWVSPPWNHLYNLPAVPFSDSSSNYPSGESGKGVKTPYTLTHTHMHAQPRGRWGGQEGISSAMQTAIVLVKKWPGSKPILPLEILLQQQCNLQPGFFSLTLPLPLCFLPSRAAQLENPSSR